MFTIAEALLHLKNFNWKAWFLQNKGVTQNS